MILVDLAEAGLASWGLIAGYGEARRWLGKRFVLDRGSAAPAQPSPVWAWRVRSRWFRPGAWVRVRTHNGTQGRTEVRREVHARVVDVDLSRPRTWVYVRPFEAGRARPCRWVMLRSLRRMWSRTDLARDVVRGLGKTGQSSQVDRGTAA